MSVGGCVHRISYHKASRSQEAFTQVGETLRTRPPYHLRRARWAQEKKAWCRSGHHGWSQQMTFL